MTIMPFLPYQYFSKNTVGRDFVVGDIHGMFSILESQLEILNFDAQTDRVFSVGDLIDRGPESHRVLEFLDKPWFFSIKGNHEKMLIEARHLKTTYRSWIKHNGGEWWEDVEETERNEIRRRLENLPIVFEIETDCGNVGIVHADLPLDMNWSDIVQKVHEEEELRDYMVWSRNRIKYIDLTGETDPVAGIELVILGHTPMAQPLKIENLIYIDTGASYLGNDSLGHLTVLQIQPDIKLFQYPQPL